MIGHLYLASILALTTACSTTPQRETTKPAQHAATTKASPSPGITTRQDPRTALAMEPHGSVTETAPEPSQDQPRHLASWASSIDQFISEPRFRHALWGIQVLDAQSGKTLYAHHADSLFVPASNTKLYTAALALDVVGGDTRFTTRLLTTADNVRGPTLRGNLILQGGGDPSLGDASVAPANAHWAKDMAGELARLGVRRVQGDLLADITLFRGVPFGTGWEAVDLRSTYAPPVSALTTNRNRMVVEVRRHAGGCCEVKATPRVLQDIIINQTGAESSEEDLPIIALRRPGHRQIRIAGNLQPGQQVRRIAQSAPVPPYLALLKLKTALLEHGIHVEGDLRVVRWPERVMSDRQHATTLYQVQSPPVRKLVHHMLKESDNLYAQTLLLQAGVVTARTGLCLDRRQTPVTSEDWGRCAMRAMLRRSGIGTAEATFSEGSGLSRHDLVTPRATTRLLQWVARQPFAHDYRSALPVAGIDGTLQWRLRDLPGQASVQAKTGTLRHTYALSGYASSIAGRPLIFSVMLNRYQRPHDAQGKALTASPSRELDRVVNIMTNQKGQSALARQPHATGTGTGSPAQ